jgi:2-keto-4-pentenoate hydratase
LSDIVDSIVRDIEGLLPFDPREDAIHGLAHAYDIQKKVTAALLERRPGRRIAGYKIAFNRPASMDYYGLSEPCYAPLFSDQFHVGRAALRFDGFRDPVIEPEIAIRLSAALAGHEDDSGVDAAIGALLPAIEIMDVRGAFSRDPSAAAAVAQRIHSEGAVIGQAGSLPTLDVGAVVARLRVDGETQGEATGAAPQTPTEALRWLSRRLAADGLPLQAGMIVLTGAHLPGFALKAPCAVRVDIAPLGTVSLSLQGS